LVWKGRERKTLELIFTNIGILNLDEGGAGFLYIVGRVRYRDVEKADFHRIIKSSD